MSAWKIFCHLQLHAKKKSVYPSKPDFFRLRRAFTSLNFSLPHSNERLLFRYFSLPVQIWVYPFQISVYLSTFQFTYQDFSLLSSKFGLIFQNFSLPFQNLSLPFWGFSLPFKISVYLSRFDWFQFTLFKIWVYPFEISVYLFKFEFTLFRFQFTFQHFSLPTKISVYSVLNLG